MTEIENRIEQLVTQIEQHNNAYWVADAPTIADVEYDQLVEELRTLCPDHPLLDDLGGRPRVMGNKYEHQRPMLSLAKAYDQETMFRWYLGGAGTEVTVTPKLDGLALSLEYVYGSLMVASTRGNGRVGDVVTHNAVHIPGVPVHLSARATVEIRGEVVMPRDVFDAKYAEEYSSPRNLAAGTLKTKEPDKDRLGDLCFWAYDMSGVETETEVDKLRLVHNLGITPIPYQRALVDDLRIPEYFQSILGESRVDASAMGTDADGVVFKNMSCAQQEALGATSHHPRAAIAWKFSGESAQSVVEDVVWQPSRTGTVNPVAVIKPVNVEDAVITRVSVHNMNIVASLGLKIGSQVVVSRRGGVIPHIESADNEGRPTSEIVPPEECPDCGAPCTVDASGFVRAPHRISCPAVLVSRYLHFIDAIDLKGLGPVHVGGLVESGLLSHKLLFTDLFLLKEDQLETVVGEANAKKVARRIQKCAPMALEVFLQSLGIPHLGKSLSPKLAQSFGSLEAVISATVLDFEALDGVGSVVAKALRQGLDDLHDHIQVLASEVGILEQAKEDQEADLPFKGLSFCFTGKFQLIKRKDAERMVVEGGGRVAGITKTLDYLVITTGRKALIDDGVWEGTLSSKLKKWKKLNDSLEVFSCKIINEEEFTNLVAAESG